MTLGTLLLYIGINALILSAVVIFLLKKSKSHWMTYLQTFCGALFVFSGWVKAVDPLGTAYKMEQYFEEFYYTFQDTAMSFIAPIFPFLSEYSVSFSVFMIVFELLLGINLLTGAYKKFTAWAFFVLTIFFTFLTGFTYLTGYVPSGTNFFAFGDWGAYKETNMRVTDCGCFGDFIKLKPMLSFFKDIFLLIPAILFIVFNGKMYQLFSPGIRKVISGLVLFGSTIYCFSNYVWDIPHVDFRPFHENSNIRERYKKEQEGSVKKVIAWQIKKPGDQETIEISNAVFMKEWGTKYKPEGYEVEEQIYSKPLVEATKISDFDFQDDDGNSIAQELMNKKEATLMIVSYKLKAETREGMVEKVDSIFRTDTVFLTETDSFVLVENFDRIEVSEVKGTIYDWDSEFMSNYKNKVIPMTNDAKKDGVSTLAVVGGADAATISKMKDAMGIEFPVYEADDILLKTIVRSNPGVVLWKDGVILKKWHIKKLPSWKEIQKYL